MRFPLPRTAFPLALAAVALGVVPPGGTEKEFEESLRVVDRTIGSGKAKKAKELLLSTLEAHRDDAFVLYHLSEIEDSLRRAAFWSVNTKPEPKTLVSGELLSWSATSGEIKLRYTLKPEKAGSSKSEKSATAPTTRGGDPKPDESVAKKKPSHAEFADFELQNRFSVHPLTFDGPFTVEVKGTSWPELTKEGRVPVILVCAEWNRAIGVQYGLFSSSGVTVPSQILQIEGEDLTKLDVASATGTAGAEYDAKVVVSAANVTAFLDDKRVLSAPRSGPIDGRFAYANFRGVREILVSGKVTPSWLMNVVDESIQKRWAEFDKTYKAADDLPSWLRDRAWAGVQPDGDPDDALPDEKTEKGRAQLVEFAKLLKEQKWDSVLERTEKAPPDELSEGSRAYLRAIALLRLGRQAEALEACTKACSLEPRLLPARRLCMVLEFPQKTVHDQIEVGRALVADFPKDPGPYVELATLLLRSGDPEQARALVRGAIDGGVPAGTLEDTEELVSRALHGPDWTKTFEYKSEHYDVCSDISERLCSDAALLLEKFYTKFDLHLRHVAPKHRKNILRVYLFSGRAGYEAYTKVLTGQESKNTAGMYSSVVKQLLIWNLPNHESILETIRHEGFHQYLDDLVEDAPKWFNEGLATYYEGSKLVKGRWSDGDLRPEYVDVLKKKALVPLGKFLRLPGREFMDDKGIDLSYAESWAFVHYLLSSGPENKKLFDRMFDALAGGARARAAVDQVFPEDVTTRLDADFASYVRGLH